MLKSQNLSNKRSQPIIRQLSIQGFTSKPRKIPLHSSNLQNIQENILSNLEKATKLNKKDLENLVVSLFENIIDQPYYDYSWEFFQQKTNLEKILGNMQISLKQFSQRLHQIKSVCKSKYSKLNFIDSLMVYWKNQGFKNKLGQSYMNKIKNLKNQKSQHMISLDSTMQKMSQRQSAFQNLYSKIMRC